MIAVISDIHSNLYALEAVLADMSKVTDLWVLGDTVGGANPFPCEVIDRIMNFHVPVTKILGNWDYWMLETRHNVQPEWRTDGTKMAAGAWTIDTLQARHWDFLNGLDTNVLIGDALLFHGSPENIAQFIDCRKDAEELAEKHSVKLLLGGHSHKAQLYRIGNQQVVGVGSIGISVDALGGTACYVLLDGENIVFRHVAYDIEKAVAAIVNSELNTLAYEFAKETIFCMRNGYYKK